jgi:hypothetical protein
MASLPEVITGEGIVPTRTERQAARQIASYRAAGAVAAARECAKVEAIAEVATTALIAASDVSAMEALVVERTPHAEARLRHIADAGAAGMANVVLKMGGRL